MNDDMRTAMEARGRHLSAVVEASAHHQALRKLYNLEDARVEVADATYKLNVSRERLEEEDRARASAKDILSAVEAASATTAEELAIKNERVEEARENVERARASWRATQRWHTECGKTYTEAVCRLQKLEKAYGKTKLTWRQRLVCRLLRSD